MGNKLKIMFYELNKLWFINFELPVMMKVPEGLAGENAIACGLGSGSLTQAPYFKRISQMSPKHTTKAEKADRIITAIMLRVSPSLFFLDTSTPKGFIASP